MGQFEYMPRKLRPILDLSGRDITTSLAAWLKSGGVCGASRTATPLREISQFKDGWVAAALALARAQDRDGTGLIIEP